MLRDHTAPVTHLVVWEDHLFSVSEDGAIRKWNVLKECVSVTNIGKEAGMKGSNTLFSFQALHYRLVGAFKSDHRTSMSIDL